jgi:hypothetical protein
MTFLLSANQATGVEDGIGRRGKKDWAELSFQERRNPKDQKDAKDTKDA